MNQTTDTSAQAQPVKTYAADLAYAAELMALGRRRDWTQPPLPPRTIEDQTVIPCWIAKLFSYGPGCWIWTGPQNPAGYGRLSVGGMEYGAHRYMYMVEHGYRAIQRMHVHHECEVKLCVNPSHCTAMTAGDHSRLHAKLRRSRS